MKWFLTVAFRWLPASSEWQYKTVITKMTPEHWLKETLESAKLGRGRLEACVLQAREITDEDAKSLEQVLAGKIDVPWTS
jgi:hypothetical protein